MTNVLIPTRGDRSLDVIRQPLGGVSVTLVLRWLERQKMWVCDGRADDGTYLWRGRGLTPGGELTNDPTVEGMPPGRILVVGSEIVRREDLGTSVQLYFAESSP